jgi:hypothetical protein
MSPQTLARRVEKLEERVTILEELPARIDDLTSQISQLREEMRGEFSAVRGEMTVASPPSARDEQWLRCPASRDARERCRNHEPGASAS